MGKVGSFIWAGSEARRLLRWSLTIQKVVHSHPCFTFYSEGLTLQNPLRLKYAHFLNGHGFRYRAPEPLAEETSSQTTSWGAWLFFQVDFSAVRPGVL